MGNIYDQSGHPLDHFDEDKGHLEKRTRVIHHEAVEGVEEQGHYDVIREYPNGGKDVEWVVDVPAVEAQDVWDETVEEYIYIPYTAEELTEIERKQKIEEENKQREELMTEVQTALVMAQINTLSVNDATALRWKPLYPEWAPNVSYEKDIRARYDDRLYKCVQPHTSQVGWEPANTPALWTEISETHSGSISDPIPYNNNMVLENGKYYTQDGVKYKCTRDTGNPVYNPLADLVGLYVDIV